MISRKTLPQDIQDVFEDILSKNPEDLTLDESVFLQARRDYLTNLEKKEFLPEHKKGK